MIKLYRLGCLTALLLTGCGQLLHRFVTPVPDGYVPNPLELPDAPPEFIQRQVVDTLDDYFRIAAEQPVVRGPGILIDGRVETVYQTGGSILEPWRKDSLPGFERLQGTFQSIRRRAIVNIRPSPNSYSIELIVQKDLEDLTHTDVTTETQSSVRLDGSRISRDVNLIDRPDTLGWIPLGRDVALEQAILADLFGRMTEPDAVGHH